MTNTLYNLIQGLAMLKQKVFPYNVPCNTLPEHTQPAPVGASARA